MLRFLLNHLSFTVPLVVILALVILGGGLDLIFNMFLWAGLILAVPFALLFLILLYVGYKKVFPGPVDDDLSQSLEVQEDIDAAWEELSEALTARLGFFDFIEVNVTRDLIEFQDTNGALIRAFRKSADGAKSHELIVEITSYKIGAAAGEHYEGDYRTDEEALAFYSSALQEVLVETLIEPSLVSCQFDNQEIPLSRPPP